jgi:hypothetical protein
MGPLRPLNQGIAFRGNMNLDAENHVLASLLAIMSKSNSASPPVMDAATNPKSG